MSDVVKRSSPERRQARTRFARRAVIDAASSLFLEVGYASTTIAAISKRADVPEPTVYRLFGSKIGILKVLLDVSIAGDDEPVALPERPAVASLLEEPDPHEVLAQFAAITTQINQRTNDLYTVLTYAADSHAEAATLLSTFRQQRDRGQTAIVRTLHRRRKLRVGLKHRDAADIVHALMSPEIYRLLITDRSWSPARFQQWATQLLIQQLT